MSPAAFLLLNIEHVTTTLILSAAFLAQAYQLCRRRLMAPKSSRILEAPNFKAPNLPRWQQLPMRARTPRSRCGQSRTPSPKRKAKRERTLAAPEEVRRRFRRKTFGLAAALEEPGVEFGNAESSGTTSESERQRNQRSRALQVKGRKRQRLVAEAMAKGEIVDEHVFLE